MKHRAFKKNMIAALLSSIGMSTAAAAVEIASADAIEKITVYGEKIERSWKSVV